MFIKKALLPAHIICMHMCMPHAMICSKAAACRLYTHGCCSYKSLTAVSRTEAARQLMQYGYYPSNQYQPAYGQDYGGSHDNFLTSHLEAKKDFAQNAIDKAKSLIEEHKGKGKSMQVSAPMYVVTSQPQIMVAPLPQLAPTMVAAAPQVQPAPSPPKVEYVPVPVSM